MPAPSWLSDTLAAVMLGIAFYCAVRLTVAGARRRESELDADGVHLLMGVAMAGMLTSALSFGSSAAWETVFAITAGWFAWQAVRVARGLGVGTWRCPYPVPHVAESLAMVYMFAAVRTPVPAGVGGAGMSGMGGASGTARFPALAAILALTMLGYVAWLGDRFTAAAAPDLPATAVMTQPVRVGQVAERSRCWPTLAPRSAVCYKIAMAVTMGYMLITML